MARFKVKLTRTLNYEIEVESPNENLADADAIEMVEDHNHPPVNPRAEAEVVSIEEIKDDEE